MKTTLISTFVIIAFFAGAFMFFQKNTETIETAETKETAETQEIKETTETMEITEITDKVISAVIKTDKGDIALELYTKVAPKTVDNFVKLSQSGFYDGIKFHRVIPSFMIQGGDPLSKTDDPRVGSGGPGYKFNDEINPRSLGLSDSAISQLETQGYTYDYSLESLPVDVGALAMANSGPNTNGSQFFIVTVSPQPHLNGKHTVFGKVISGMDVARSIEQGDVILDININ